MSTQALTHVQATKEGVFSRRSFLRTMGAGAVGAGMLGWKDLVTLNADELRKKGMACILLFMRGGPSQLETFDPKPGSKSGGPTKAISTAVDGIQIAEHWPNVAKQMKDLAIIRSMTNREGQHQRAVYQLHTCDIPAGGIKHPGFGSIVASEIAPDGFDLPHFVSIGNRFNTLSASFLGMSFAPFVVQNPTQMPNNVELPRSVKSQSLDRRLALMKELEEDFAKSGARDLVDSHRELYKSAAKMVKSERLKAFDLSQEKASVRAKYGQSSFGQGCLLARRLVERGVTFVEVDSNGWDTHQDNFTRVKSLSSQVDSAMATLIADLKERGMLERTLVIWMGEFGRTPRINARTGRDHFPRAFNVALAGGGVKGGQVIGSTSANGTTVKERPVSVVDLFSSFCKSLKINPAKENLSQEGRPLKIVDGGAPVKELF